MNYPVKIEDIEPSLEFYDEVIPLIKRSKEYLLRQKWCKSIQRGWLFTNIGYAFNIYLYEIENVQSPEDNFLWVMVGDLPAVYLDTYNVKSTKEVVEVYVDLADDWIQHARSGQSLDECFPFEAAPSTELISMLETRTRRLQNNILPNIDDINRDVVMKNE